MIKTNRDSGLNKDENTTMTNDYFQENEAETRTMIHQIATEQSQHAL
jgi:hypothetical protein